jgi:hypothetical protein
MDSAKLRRAAVDKLVRFSKILQNGLAFCWNVQGKSALLNGRLNARKKWQLCHQSKMFLQFSECLVQF